MFQTVFYGSGYKSPGGRSFGSGMEIAYVKKESNAGSLGQAKGKPQEAADPVVYHPVGIGRCAENEAKRWELMGVTSPEDREVAKNRAFFGLSPLNSKEMQALRDKGRDPSYAAIQERDEPRFFELERAPDEDRIAWLREWKRRARYSREVAQPPPGTSAADIFSGRSRLGKPPMHYVFRGYSSEVADYYRDLREMKRRYLMGE